MCDEFGRNIATLEETRGAATTKPRQELVLKRYPVRHFPAQFPTF